MYKKPLFIVFEGIEGCGKSYQSKRLAQNLKKKKILSVLTREPGGTQSAELIRNLILKDYFTKNNVEKFDKYTDTLLYLAARNEHVKNKILPSLKKKRIVICDRFTDSTIAYQVFGKKVPFNFISNIHKYILNSVKPDLTFILKVSRRSSKKRLRSRKTKNRYDNFSQIFYDRAQRAFLKIAKGRRNYYIFDSSANNKNLEKKIFEIVYKKLKNQ
tara:strand:+ start:31 stop:675 length:645 start_codon:yes stop_codon:yes gene_type:complete